MKIYYRVGLVSSDIFFFFCRVFPVFIFIRCLVLSNSSLLSFEMVVDSPLPPDTHTIALVCTCIVSHQLIDVPWI